MAGSGGAGAVRTAGRGGVAVLAAKVFFIGVGLVQQMVLPRVIGLAGYGALSRVMAAANIVNNVVVASSIQAMSREMAQARSTGREHAAFWAAMRVHAGVALAVSVLFAAASPALAAFQRSPHIQWPLATMALITFAYGLYAPMVGSLNGRARFGRQAALDATAATGRTAGLLGGGALAAARGASGPLGAALGAAFAALAMVPIAFRAAKLPRDATEGTEPHKGYVQTLGNLAMAQLFTNALMQVDLWFLGRTLSQGAPSSVAADEWVAVYRACQLFAFLPFQLLMSVAQILFPMVARARAEQDAEGVTFWVTRGMRLALLAGGLLVGVVVALPEPLLSLAFGPDVAMRGAATLRILAMGQGAFTIFGVACAVLVSLGRERATAGLSLLAIVLVALGISQAAANAPFGEAQLRTTAMVTTVALAVALTGAGWRVRKEAGGFVSARTTVRTAVAFATCVATGLAMPSTGKVSTLVAAAACSAAYVAALFITGELSQRDLMALRSLGGRRGG